MDPSQGGGNVNTYLLFDSPQHLPYLDFSTPLTDDNDSRLENLHMGLRSIIRFNAWEIDFWSAAFMFPDHSGS